MTVFAIEKNNLQYIFMKNKITGKNTFVCNSNLYCVLMYSGKSCMAMDCGIKNTL